jgi:hypothetical protein
MSSLRVRRAGVISCVLMGLLAMPAAVHAKGPSSAASKAEPARVSTAANAVSVYAVEFQGDCGPPIFPGKLGAIVNAAAPRDWVLRASGSPPLVSREAVVYSSVGTSGTTSLPPARIFAEVASGGELSFKSDKGANVVLQVDVKSVCWDVDQERAVELAKARGSARALIAVLRWEDMTADANPGGELGHQKSVHVSLDMTLVESGTGAVLGNFSDESRQMDLSAVAAVRRGAKALAAKGFKSLTSDTK